MSSNLTHKRTKVNRKVKPGVSSPGRSGSQPLSVADADEQATLIGSTIRLFARLKPSKRGNLWTMLPGRVMVTIFAYGGGYRWSINKNGIRYSDTFETEDDCAFNLVGVLLRGYVHEI